MARHRVLGLASLLAGVLWSVPLSTQAATNAAQGGIGGINNGTLIGGDGTGSAQVTLNVVDLALVKQARDPAGTVLPAGAPVVAGQDVWFLLYVDNPTSAPADSLEISDALDESAFTYVPGTLQITTLAAGASDAATWSAAWTPLSDALNGPDDAGAFTDAGGPAGLDLLTIGTVPSQTNLAVTLPALSRLAVRFRARVN